MFTAVTSTTDKFYLQQGWVRPVWQGFSTEATTSLPFFWATLKMICCFTHRRHICWFDIRKKPGSVGTCYKLQLSHLGWRSSTVGRAMDLRFTGRGFESWLGITHSQWPSTMPGLSTTFWQRRIILLRDGLSAWVSQDSLTWHSTHNRWFCSQDL